MKAVLDEINSKLNQGQHLIAVSKTKPIELIEEAYNLGQRDFGENKVQDLLEKSNALSGLKDIRWHFIGTLQSNKINNLLKVKNLVSIHSIDSMKLLTKILNKEIDSKIGIFLQVNTSDEKEKGGFVNLEELKEVVSGFNHSHFYLQGLMTIGKIRTENFEKDAKECFSKLKRIKEEIDSTLELSMGMSNDYLIALNEGSNWIRVGSKIFGVR